MDYSKLHDDIWYHVFIYLDLKSIYTAEITDIFFQNVLKRTKFWNRKIRKDFPQCDDVLLDLSEEKSYVLARRFYFDMYRLTHACNICKLCFINIYEDIPHSEWRDYIDWMKWIKKKWRLLIKLLNHVIFADPFLLVNVLFHQIWSSNNIVVIIIFSKNTEIKMSVKYILYSSFNWPINKITLVYWLC